MNNENQRNLTGELSKWKQLRAQLEDIEGMDELCLLDTLEGETDLHEAILALDEEITERETNIEALKLRIAALQERKDRNEKVREKLRTIILQAMDNAGLPKIQAPHVTISVKALGPEMYIDNESQIPSKFWVPQDPKLDKKALQDAVEAGEAVEGVMMGNGRINLTIRRK